MTLSIILILSVVALVGYYATKSPTEQNKVTDELNTVFRGRKGEVARLHTWLEANVSDEEIRNWLSTLSEADFKKLAQSTSQFISRFDFKTAWLGDEGLRTQAPLLSNAVEDSVLSFVNAYGKSANNQGDVKVYETFVAWNQKPNTRAHRELGERLFMRLLSDGLVDPSVSSALITASAKDRQEYMVRVIRDFAATNSDHFFMVLREALNLSSSNETPSQADETVAEPAIEAS